MESDSNVRVGLALSGGGFRAAAFHLGVLKRLEELQVIQRISLLSTVSGGSITGALYALRCARTDTGQPGSYPVDKLITEMAEFLQVNLRGHALWGTPSRLVRTAASFLIPGVRRTPLLVAEFDRRLFGNSRLPELPPWITINATNLATGKNWRFCSDRAGDFLAGATDQTESISIAEAVGASAAYPGLTDPYPFRTRWEELRGDLLDHRWQRPSPRPGGGWSAWRDRHGRSSGRVVMPLVDGGIYDNDGTNALRGARISHAIVSTASAGDTADFAGAGFRSLLRLVGVMHARLGAASRQLSHEMTHGVHPTAVRAGLRDAATRLRKLSDPVGDLHSIANELDGYAAVGWPPRGHQFEATAPIILHRDDLARNVSAAYRQNPYDVPAAFRGVEESLVPLLAGVRTDLDALEEGVMDLLMAQGYFLTDLHLKVAMPRLVSVCTGLQDIHSAEPKWAFATEVVQRANDDPHDTAARLEAAARRSLFGRS